QLYNDAVTGIDLDNRLVHCADRPPVKFDVLSINTGSTPFVDAVPGAREHSIPVKPIDNFLEKWQAIQEAQRTADKAMRFVTVGAGAGGVELTMGVQHALRESGCTNTYTVVTQTDTILPTHSRGVQRKYEKTLADRGIAVKTQCPVERVEPNQLILKNGETIEFDALFWVTNAAPPKWPGNAGLATDAQGFIAVNDRLQSESHPYVFAAGDIASCAKFPRPKSGVFAVRQGPPLTENIRRLCAEQPLKAFRPQGKFLSLISTGDQNAVASYGALSLQGPAIWKWKDQIDRKWMQKYQDLPEMEPDQPEKKEKLTVPELLKAPVMHCGGCGSKVGSSTLSRVIKRLQPITRDDVLIGLDDPDDAAVTVTPAGYVGVHTIDFFRSFIHDPYVFGQIAANHALSDIFAMGAEAQSALAMATVPFGDEENVEEQLFQVMAGALKMLNECNCALAGGHTTMDTQLAFGLCVHGIAEEAKLMKKGGMKAGEKLILTKAVGTGTLFAADMRNQAKGVWAENAIDSMLLSNYRAGQILHAHGATACTDVTGFGLLGHLIEMLKASGAKAKVILADVPILDGALDCMRAGIYSSLQPDNLRLRRGVTPKGTIAEHETYPILFDPQTSGGLLASVPADRVDPALTELKILYPATTVIGEIVDSGEADIHVNVT
ncbi:MAG: selenide, water dikinase SelD, partial [Verrucomicrobiota bacterium]